MDGHSASEDIRQKEGDVSVTWIRIIFSSKLFAAAAVDYKSQLVGSKIQTVCLSNQLSLFLAANTDAADF